MWDMLVLIGGDHENDVLSLIDLAKEALAGAERSSATHRQD
jgi:hypothetical protein